MRDSWEQSSMAGFLVLFSPQRATICPGLIHVLRGKDKELWHGWWWWAALVLAVTALVQGRSPLPGNILSPNELLLVSVETLKARALQFESPSGVGARRNPLAWPRAQGPACGLPGLRKKG